jgi:tRNA dimethylallyltransferase
MSIPKVLVLSGPTASGKTALSYLISNLIREKLSKEPVIISADSRQVFKYIPISTSYPPKEYLHSIKHYFIGQLKLDSEFNAGEFGKQARDIIQNSLTENKIPIIVGGSGLYLHSLIYGLFDFTEAAGDTVSKEMLNQIRQKLAKRLEEEGIEKLLEELKIVDGESALKMKVTNQRRILRALEVYYMTGIPISRLQSNKVDVGFEPVQYALNWERQKLYDRINLRVDEMIKNGLIAEVKSLKEKGYHYSVYNSLNTVGVKEVFDYLEDKLDYDTMVKMIKQSTRRFAKRQLTWFRKDKNINWVEINEAFQLDPIAEKIFDLFFQVQ